MDQAVHALVTDLEVRGLLNTTLVLVLGEFGRGPAVNKNGGRDHWPYCMSMLLAGGGLARGQVVGSTDAKGSDVKDARVAAADLSATVYHHLGIPLDAQWTDLQGRPESIVTLKMPHTTSNAVAEPDPRLLIDRACDVVRATMSLSGRIAPLPCTLKAAHGALQR